MSRLAVEQVKKETGKILNFVLVVIEEYNF